MDGAGAAGPGKFLGVIEEEGGKGEKHGGERGRRHSQKVDRKGKAKMSDDTNGHGVEDIPLIMRRLRMKRSGRKVDEEERWRS